jgi:hypothetical protein
MATPQLSPGVLIREVDLTVGRAENVLDNIGVIAGPFPIGPVNDPVNIETEREFLDIFGKPLGTDRQYEYWLTANSFLSYGGILKVVRVDGPTLRNGNAGVGQSFSDDVKIDNEEKFIFDHSEDTSYYYAARNGGTWSNGLKVCTIDNRSDQIIGVGTTNPGALGLELSYGVTANRNSVSIPDPGNGKVGTFTGTLKGIITGINTDSINGQSTIEVRVLHRQNPPFNDFSDISETTASAIAGIGVTEIQVNNTSGIETGNYAVTPNNATIEIVDYDGSSITLKSGITSEVSVGAAVTYQNLVSTAGTAVPASYEKLNAVNSFTDNDVLSIFNKTDDLVATITPEDSSVKDWYDQQTLGLDNSIIFWRSLAGRPVDNQYVRQRGGANDAIHVVVVDDTGNLTGIQGNILESFTFLSKSTDATADADNPTNVYYKDFITQNSKYIFPGYNPSIVADNFRGTQPIPSGFSTDFIGFTTAEGLWGQPAKNIKFSSIGNVTYSLGGGVDYSQFGGMGAELGDVINGYQLFADKDEIEVDYLLMGPGSTDDNETEAQAKANFLISLAESRKDCIATISPERSTIVNISDPNEQTENIIEFYSPLTSSSYAIFDSGYKFTFDRFNNQFRYIPTNGDIAGLCVRTSIEAFPWFSPAGLQRGNLNNAIKMAYNPNKAERDELYSSRINPVINIKGSGIVLFGDKTALSFSSAFDRINVRRLFLFCEQSLEGAANAQLFELNDESTRANFVNIVEPFLRDVQAKRGLFDYLVVCDETNNTPDIIDNNEFRADIFLKPAKSINYVTLTFVATRTGVDFQEVVGTV